MTESLSVGALVAALPEKYQPIFAHPELSDGSSRSCEDRLVLIRECARQLQEVVGRPLRVLDLGCAQGFFSLSLAADGHRVHGVDFLDLNVHVCEALAKQNPKFEATFEHGTVEDVIERLEPGEYDLVLGLSVFHHLVHARGVVSVSALCRKLSEVAGAGIFELALREEPLYWAPSLPHDPAELLSSYAFTRLLSRQPTHLSTISRPLIFASSRFWYVGESVGEFTSWSSESHAHGRGTHQHSRRYYFGEQVFVKKMTLGLGGRAEINLQEFQNEVAFLRNPPASYPAAPLIEALNDSSDLFLVRAMTEGRLLSELIDEGVPYDADQVLSELLDQLVVLEGEGLYHNDVRCWNVLISGEGRALLIDYGAISSDAKDCSWLEDLLLSFLITTREILERRIVPSNPGREPALDFTSLPPRYRNAFLLMFSQDPSRWTYAGLRDCFVHSEAVASPAPEWTSIYQHLQGALVSYNTRLSSLYAQTEHDRVELAARGAALERVREIALHAEEELVTLKVEAEAADKRRLALEESGRLLADWAKELEEHAVKSDAELKVEMEAAEMRSRGLEESRRLLIERAEELEAQATESEARATQMVARVAELEVDGQQMTERVAELEAEGQQMTGRMAELEADGQQMTGRMAELEADGQQMTERVAELEADGEQMAERMAELVAVNGTLVTQIVELDLELDELQCAREAAEVRAAEVGPLTGERDALLVKLSDGQRVEEQHEATAHYLRGEAASLLHRIERLERSRAHDRRRLKELQADLSQGVQTMGSSRARVRELEMAVEALEAQIDSVYASRSWRVTAPLRWFTNKVLKRGDATPVPLDAATQRSSTKVVRGDVPSPADAAVEKRLAALDQLASRIRKSRQ